MVNQLLRSERFRRCLWGFLAGGAAGGEVCRFGLNELGLVRVGVSPAGKGMNPIQRGSSPFLRTGPTEAKVIFYFEGPQRQGDRASVFD